MTSVQMHLALTHVPIILFLTGLIMLIVALIQKNNATIKTTSYLLMLVAGITSIPVFFTGEGAEEAIENLPGVSESIIENHEKWAQITIISISLSGLVALAALIFNRFEKGIRIFKPMLLISGLITSSLLVQTAHLGGQIRHTEIRNSLSKQLPEQTGGSGTATEKNEEKETD